MKKYNIKKATYNISYRNADGVTDAGPVSGYIFSYCGLRFGLSRCHGFNKNFSPRISSAWHVTELYSGLSLGRPFEKSTLDETIRNLNENYYKYERAIKAGIEKYIAAGGRDVNHDQDAENELTLTV